MKKNCVLGIAALSAVLLLAGCGSKKPELTPTEYCEQNGGIAQEGICFFEDGSYCEEVAYSNGECTVGENVYDVVDEAAIAEYCVDNGGQLNVEDGAYLCMFADGSYCEAESYFYGECIEGEIMYNVLDEEVVDEELAGEEVAEEVAEEIPAEEVVEEATEEVEQPAEEVVEEVAE